MSINVDKQRSAREGKGNELGIGNILRKIHLLQWQKE